MMATNAQIALLIIDAQRDFFDLSGTPYESDPTALEAREKTIAAIARNIEYARKHKMPVLWTHEMHRPDTMDMGLELKCEGPHCIEGTPGMELLEELQPLVEVKDLHIRNKRRWDAFYQTDLELVLRSLGIDTLIIVGAEAGACVLATAFGAKMRDIEIILSKEGIWGSPERIDALFTIASFAKRPLLTKDLEKLN